MKTSKLADYGVKLLHAEVTGGRCLNNGARAIAEQVAYDARAGCAWLDRRMLECMRDESCQDADCRCETLSQAIIRIVCYACQAEAESRIAEKYSNYRERESITVNYY